MDFAELTQRLYARYAPVNAAAANLAGALENKPWVALAGLLKVGAERGDLTVDEANAGLREAETVAFGGLSEQVAAQLRAYLGAHTVA